MLAFITVLHILVAICLVTVVLLQDAKGGAMGIMGGGGGSQSVFGATGATNFLVKATRWLGALFVCTCLALTYFSTHQDTSVTDELLPAAEAPIESAHPTAAPAEDGKAAPENK